MKVNNELIVIKAFCLLKVLTTTTSIQQLDQVDASIIYPLVSAVLLVSRSYWFSPLLVAIRHSDLLQYIPVYSKPVNLDGSSLPADEFGRYVFGITDRERSVIGILSTDQVGLFLYSVIGPDSELY